MVWRFVVFVSSTGRSDVQDDVDRLTEYGSQNLQAQLRYLRTAPIEDWHEPHAKKIKGAQDLYEIRFKDHRTQTRALGFFTDSEFVITVIATHKGNVYKPHSAFETAGRRRKAILSRQAASVPLKIDGEEFSETVE